MKKQPEWLVFTKPRWDRCSIVFASTPESFSAEFHGRHPKRRSFQLPGSCDGIDINVNLQDTPVGIGVGNTVWIHDGELQLGDSIKGDVSVRNGWGKHPYAEIELPGLRHPILLVMGQSRFGDLCLDVLNLDDATVSFYPTGLGFNTPQAIRRLTPRGYSYFGDVALKDQRPCLAELSRCCIAVLVGLTEFIVEPYYMSGSSS